MPYSNTKDSTNECHTPTTMSRASKAAMDTLHVQLATVLKDGIGELSKADDKKGLAALLNVARQFLKDNEVTALGVPDSPLKSLADSLPFAGSEFSDDGDSPVH